jgi:hypothetical protein
MGFGAWPTRPAASRARLSTATVADDEPTAGLCRERNSRRSARTCGQAPTMFPASKKRVDQLTSIIATLRDQRRRE